MSPGKRDQPVIIQRREIRANDFEGGVDRWKTIHVGWASLKTLSAKEVAFAQQITEQATHSLVLDYAGIQFEASDRIVHRTTSDVYEITGVADPDAAQRQIQIYAVRSARPVAPYTEDDEE